MRTVEYELIESARSVSFGEPSDFRSGHGIRGVCRNDGDNGRDGHLVLALPVSYPISCDTP